MPPIVLLLVRETTLSADYFKWSKKGVDGTMLI